MRSCLPIAVLAAATLSASQDVDPGKLVFESRCARCHGADGSGGEMGPDIRSRAASRNDQQLANIFHEGSGAMLPVAVTESELAPLIRFLRYIEPRQRPRQRINVRTLDGKILEGDLLNQGFDDLQLRDDDDGRIHLSRRVGDRFREASGGVDWVGYNGDPGGNRYSTLTQINKPSLDRLAPRWTFTLQGAGLLQATPVVVGGIMYRPLRTNATPSTQVPGASCGIIAPPEKRPAARTGASRWPAIAFSWRRRRFTSLH